MRPYIKKKKKKPQNRAGGVAQGICPEFKLQYRKKNIKYCPLEDECDKP
jgi:hypothetical protein